MGNIIIEFLNFAVQKNLRFRDVVNGFVKASRELEKVQAKKKEMRKEMSENEYMNILRQTQRTAVSFDLQIKRLIPENWTEFLYLQIIEEIRLSQKKEEESEKDEQQPPEEQPESKSEP